MFVIRNLSSLSEEERNRVLAKASQILRSEPNGEIEELDEELADFERRHGMSSTRMMEQMREGKIRETFELCRWSMILDLRDRLSAQRSARP